MRLLSNTTFLITVLAAVSLRWEESYSAPPPPPGPQLELSCPTAMVREATSPQGTDVHFDAPTPTGGRAPYSVQCNPGSSSMFAIGETPVRCTATDADRAQASCGFRGHGARHRRRSRRRSSWRSATASPTGPCHWHRSSCWRLRIRIRSNSSRCSSSGIRRNRSSS